MGPLRRCEITWYPMDADRSRYDLSFMANSHEPTALRLQPQDSLLRQVEHYAAAVSMVALATLAGLWLAPRWGTGPVDMLYLPAVLAAAALWGIGPGIVAGIAAAVAYNFFFTEPLHTLQ